MMGTLILQFILAVKTLQDVAYCMWWILQHVGIVAERVAWIFFSLSLGWSQQESVWVQLLLGICPYISEKPFLVESQFTNNEDRHVPFFSNRVSKALVEKSSTPPSSWKPTILSVATPSLQYNLHPVHFILIKSEVTSSNAWIILYCTAYCKTSSWGILKVKCSSD